MTADEINAMPAGRELDAMVAERVMGWERVDPPPVELARANAAGDEVRRGDWWRPPNHPAPHAVLGVPPYSTDMNDAWQVVHRMRSLGLGMWMDATAPDLGIGVDFDGIKGAGETEQLAICRAALLVTLANEKPRPTPTGAIPTVDTE